MLPRSAVSGLVRIPWAGPRVLFRLHRRGFGFDRVTWDELAALVLEERPRHLSVDVFDTCLIRDLAGDESIELAISHRLSTAPDRPQDGDQASIIADELERELCRPVVGAVAALRTIRTVVPDITFVSDTGRSSELLIHLLRWRDLFEDGDRLFASCEVGATKSRGDLFSRVWTEKERSDGVWHVGNSSWADGVMAAGRGLRPFQIVEADLNRYEATMAETAGSEGPVIAGAARLARLDIEADVGVGKLTPRQADAQILGAGIGQALVAFDLWLADQVERENITSLGFLARDGELPMRIAHLLPADYWPGVSVAYLHCSRMVWSLASASAVGLDEWLAAGTKDENAFLETHRHDVPLMSLLARIGLTVEDLEHFGPGGFRALRSVPTDRPLPAEAVEAWHELLFDQQVGELILERSENRRQLLVDYVQGEGLRAGRLGLVDVGWRGRLAWHISQVLRSAGAEEPIHFHFGGTKIIPEVDSTVDIRRFAFDGSESDFFTSSPVSCVETLTASGKPRVTDYRRTAGGEVVPLFDGGEFDNDGDRADLWAGALRTAANIPSRKKLDEWGVIPTHLGQQARHLLALWWNSPTKVEAEAIARIMFERDEAGTAFCQVATPYQWRELAHLTPSVRAWRQGSEAITPAPVRQMVKAGRYVKSWSEGWNQQ
ncbi:MAG: hypothetical protein OER95_09955 [Acidimicrobiia bacterium]|nr:hypothetical protein [Acidimicrobiia bacterium]